jgi:hypothetical protein
MSRFRTLVANRWMFAPVLLLGASVTGAFLAVTFAVAGKPVGEERDYYRKAVDWDATRAAALRSELLQWNASPSFVAGEDGVPRVRIALRDKHGLALDGATVSVEAIPVKIAERAGTVALAPLGHGDYEAALPAIVLGQWELRVTVERDGKLWTDSYRRILVPASGRTAGGGDGAR